MEVGILRQPVYRHAGREGYHAFLHCGLSSEPYLEGLRERGGTQPIATSESAS
jgi:hypothetical protein